MAQWRRICRPKEMGEDPTCRGATKLVHDNYRAWAPELGSAAGAAATVRLHAAARENLSTAVRSQRSHK